jgi:hypothetical protein
MQVQTLCGIFDTNCFELFPSGAGDTISGKFIQYMFIGILFSCMTITPPPARLHRLAESIP